MQALSLEPNVIAYSAAVSACERRQEWEQAVALLADMQRGGPAPNVVTYSAVISACEKAAQWQSAIHILAGMQQRSEKLDKIVYSAAISACEKGERWEEALFLLAEMRRRDFEPHGVAYNAALSACEKCGAWQQGLVLLDSMRRLGVEPGLITFNAAVSACGPGESWRQAVRLLARVQQGGLEPDEITCTAMLAACEEGAAWASTLQLLRQGQEHWGVRANGLHYGSAISVLKKAGLGERVLATFQEARVLWAGGDVARGPDGAGEARASRGAPLPEELLAWAPGVAALAKPPGVSTEAFLERLGPQLRALGGAGGITVVSRLDLLTSGSLVVALGGARTAAANLATAQFAGRLVSKRYLCLCAGPPLGPVGASCVVASPLTRTRLGRESWHVSVSTQGKEACTEFSTLLVYSDPAGDQDTEVLSLVLAKPRTGRTHQIRVHLASLSRPLVADPRYRGPSGCRQDAAWCRRMFLHCRRVTLWDATGSDFVAQAPLPDDLRAALGQLQPLGEVAAPYEKVSGQTGARYQHCAVCDDDKHSPDTLHLHPASVPASCATTGCPGRN